MADYTTIDDPSVYFQANAYTGNGSDDHAITNGGNSDLQPDIIWIKERDNSGAHSLHNTMGSISLFLEPNATSANAFDTTTVKSVQSDGFTLGTESNHNQSSTDYIAWQWKVNGGTTSSNTDGDLTTTVQVNQTAGISIFTYTGLDPIEPLDLGHGLGAVPEFFFIKKTNSGTARNWGLYHKDMAATPQNNYLRLNSANAVAAASTWWRNEAPTSTIIKTGEQADVNQPSDTFVCYAWKSVQGFSKYGKYTGNGDATNGPFIYTGFSPAWVMIKNADTAARPWYMFDNKRRTFNPNGSILKADTSDAEATDQAIDMLSNGFKVRPDSLGSFGTSSLNHSGQTIIYMAFAQHPFVTSTSANSIPTTAR